MLIKIKSEKHPLSNPCYLIKLVNNKKKLVEELDMSKDLERPDHVKGRQIT